MRHLTVFMSLAVAVASCGGSGNGEGTAAPAPAARVENAVPESQLARVTLSAEAEAHLAIQTHTVELQSVSPTRTVGGEAIVQPGRVRPKPG